MEIIAKPKTGWPLAPNLLDYSTARASFSWEAARRALEGVAVDGGLNIAHEAIDRHALGARENHAAIRWLGAGGEVQTYTYGNLRRLSNRFANLLRDLGVGKGERVCSLVGRIPELYIAVLGTLKNQSVFCPLFSAFGPQPLRTRLALSKAKVLVTSERLYLRRVKPLRDSLPDLEHVLIVGDGSLSGDLQGALDFHSLMCAASEDFMIEPTDPETMALLHFTSGTTGNPKGAVHVHAAVIAHYISAKLALDLHPSDTFWCTADPGWVTGISYGVIAPLVIGATLLVDSQEFDAERWYGILQDHQVNVWYTAPTAIRMMMRLKADVAKKYDLSALRFAASVGEPLDAEAVLWGLRTLGKPFHDTWWQTETGAIMIANFAALDIKPGSMGKPLPGIEAAIVRRSDTGRVERIEQANIRGELTLRSGWPSMFRGYLDDDARYRRCFADGWYLTGDLARCDDEGYFWFAGRGDDMIKSSGHLIGPFEVEQVLLKHPAVADAAVIGKPDPLTHEVVKAIVSLKPGYTGDESLIQELLAHARKRLGATVAPREIEFRGTLPRTRSGKVMRRVLRAQELGRPADEFS
jgi:acetyl-CoA synthetase